MEVKVLNNSSFKSVSATYGLDKNVNFKTVNRNTYHGFDITLDLCLSATKDTTINNYSSLFLSNDIDYDKFIDLQSLTLPSNFTFTSYISIPSTETLYLKSKSNKNNPTSEVLFDTTLDSNSYFEIYFIDSINCKLRHTENNTTRYLSYNYIDSEFLMLTGDDIIRESDLNTFQYIYNKDSGIINFSKQILDKNKILAYNPTNNRLIFDNTTNLNSSLPYSKFQNFYLRSNKTTLNDKLSTSNYVYQQTNNNTVLKVDLNKSDYTYNTNFLFNNEYYNLNPYINNNFNVNILNLKNQKTVSNVQSNGGLFLNQPSYKHRYYESLFTGVNQEKGNNNIGLGFSSYTLTRLLKKDALTYFHIPYDIYPFEKLNINDSSLVESGAIASDTPYYSDKIFKRLNDYIDSSPFGDVSDTQTGAFLCSWLSGNNNINDKGVWVDRYYNPARVTFNDAFTIISPISGLTTNFNEISSITSNNNFIYDIYDVKSNLTFEKGALYAYHHIGNKNCSNFVDNLSGNLIINQFDNYFTFDYNRKLYEGEINFNFNHFAKTFNIPLEKVSNKNNLTLVFDLYNNDWNKPFGAQIIGNYTNNGLGIFNYNRITPHTVLYDKNKIYIYNTKGVLLTTIVNKHNIISLNRFEPNSIFIVFDEAGNVTKYNYIGTILERKNYSFLTLPGNKDFYSYNEDVYILVQSSWYKLNSNSLKVYDQYSLNLNTVKIGSSFTGIVYVNNTVYLLDTYNPKVYGNKIYSQTNDSIQYYDIITSLTHLVVEGGKINDYVLSKNILYILFDDDKIAVRDNFARDYFMDSNLLSLSTITGFDNSYNISIDNIDEWYEDKHIDNYLTILSLSSNDIKNSGNLCYTRLKNDFYISDNIISENFVTGNLLIDYNFKGKNNNNYNYLLNNFDSGKTISSKVKLPNVYDIQTYETCTLNYELSNLNPGYHNFAFSLDTVNGLYNLYIDGKVVDTYTFDNGKYSFANLFSNTIYIGTQPSYGGNKLNENLRDINYYNFGNFKLKNFYMYNIPFYVYDVANVIRSKYTIQDINFELPTGKRSYIENIQRYFKNKLPGRKSNLLNLSIQDSSIDSKVVQEDINEEIFANIIKVLPANTKLNKIKWNTYND